MDKTTQALELITGSLLQANVAIPIVFSAINGIASIIKGVTGTGPSLGEIATLIEAQVAANDTAGRAEIARLKAALGDN